MLGAVLVSLGYALAVIGGALLFFNTPPDVGGTYALMIPRVSEDEFQGTERDSLTRVLESDWFCTPDAWCNSATRRVLGG